MDKNKYFDVHNSKSLGNMTIFPLLDSNNDANVSYVRFSVCCVLITLGVFLNVVVIYINARKLRKSTYILLFSLAICDLVNCLVILLDVIKSMNTVIASGEKILCTIQHFLTDFGCLVSATLVTCVAFDRYLRTKYLKYSLSRRQTVLLISSVVGCLIIVTCPFLVSRIDKVVRLSERERILFCKRTEFVHLHDHLDPGNLLRSGPLLFLLIFNIILTMWLTGSFVTMVTLNIKTTVKLRRKAFSRISKMLSKTDSLATNNSSVANHCVERGEENVQEGSVSDQRVISLRQSRINLDNNGNISHELIVEGSENIERSLSCTNGACFNEVRNNFNSEDYERNPSCQNDAWFLEEENNSVDRTKRNGNFKRSVSCTNDACYNFGFRNYKTNLSCTNGSSFFEEEVDNNCRTRRNVNYKRSVSCTNDACFREERDSFDYTRTVINSENIAKLEGNSSFYQIPNNSDIDVPSTVALDKAESIQSSVASSAEENTSERIFVYRIQAHADSAQVADKLATSRRKSNSSIKRQTLAEFTGLKYYVLIISAIALFLFYFMHFILHIIDICKTSEYLVNYPNLRAGIHECFGHSYFVCFVLNPVIYNFFNRGFIRGLKKLFICCRPERITTRDFRRVSSDSSFV